jgi:hypothetical protein
MGQFKPMVKMETTEPSVELKLKKGGSVKKADGGMMGAPSAMPPAMPPSMPPSMPARGGSMGAKAPLAPSLAARRRAMKMMGSGPAAPIGMAASRMKEGGKADIGQDKAMIKKAFKQHDMQEHKGGKGTSLKLKHGGKMATGGVVNGQGGYAKGGIINTEDQGGEYRNTKMDTAKPDRSPAKTGGVKLGNGGGYATGGVAKSNGGGYKKGGKVKGMMDGGMVGNSMAGNGMMDDGTMNNGMYSAYKKGGSAKKAYAAGGTVDSGRPVAMPQGRKPASKPVAINELAGTYKKGGRVAPGNRALQSVFNKENSTAMRQAKAMTNEKYGPASMMKLKDGGKVDLSKGAYDATLEEPPMGMGFAKKAHSFMDSLFSGKKEAGAGRGFVNPKSVTKSKESVTVAPMKKGGSANC